MKKIAVLVYNNYDRDLRVIRETEALKNQGYQPVVFCSINKPDEEKIIYEKRGIKVIRMVDRLPYIFKNPFKLKPFYEMKKIILNYPERFNFIHCHDLNASLVGYTISKKLKIPFICDFHELFINYFVHYKKNIIKKAILFIFNLFWTFLAKKIVREAEAFITVNNSLSRLYSTKWKLKKEPVVIHNYNSIRNNTNKIIEEGYLRKKYIIPDSKKILIFQGTLFYDKGIEVILSAFRKQEKYVIVFIGMGVLKEKIEQYAKLYTGIYYYHPPVAAEDLLEYTKCADAGLAPIGISKKNHFYSSPNKVYEYIAAGIPFVCTDLPEMSKIVKESNVGIVVEPDNPQALYEGVEELFQAENYEIMKNAAKDAFSKKYSWEKEESKLIQLFEQMKV